ncbi:hypothetical protein B0H17DRAFT_1196414 [Mycena rosella]|uniref:Uncharacterized protein n=1 Tax=Mycena rosella TaxID=1033263 RepID=A0AAD7GKS5_MYCRO|nr:hypothetical protein B0H17DRAFT_1196414 [Mycena rosella]
MPDGADPAHYVVPSASICLLCSYFPNLLVVRLQSPTGFDLDGATAWAMARAWPLAEGRHGRGAPSTPLDAETVPPVPNPGSDGSRPIQTSLMLLNVGASPISTPSLVAAFISGLFPALCTLTAVFEDDEDESHGALWEEVGTLLPVMQSLREKRCWAKQGENG